MLFSCQWMSNSRFCPCFSFSPPRWHAGRQSKSKHYLKILIINAILARAVKWWMSLSVTQVVIALLCSNETYCSFNQWGVAVAKAVNSVRSRRNDVVTVPLFLLLLYPHTSNPLCTQMYPWSFCTLLSFHGKNNGRLNSLIPRIHTVARKHLVWQYEKSRAGSSWCFGLALSHGLVLHIGLTSLHFPLGQNCPRKLLWQWLCYVENIMLLLSHSSY